MEIDVLIESFTPCLVERATQTTVSTSYRTLEKSEIETFASGWRFNWLDPLENDFKVYGLTLESGELQGLIAIKPSNGFLEVSLVESAPHNVGSTGKYDGVGAHLFAIATKISFERGFDGFTSFVSKTGLVEHYKKTLLATQIGNTQKMYLDTIAAKTLMRTYFKKESLS